MISLALSWRHLTASLFTWVGWWEDSKWRYLSVCMGFLFKDVYLHTPHTPHQSCTIHHTVDSFMIVHINVWWEGHGWAGSSWRQVRCGISLSCCTCQDSNWSVGWSRPGLPEVLLPLNNFTVCSRARLRTIIQCKECGNGLIDWYPLEEMQNMHDNDAI